MHCLNCDEELEAVFEGGQDNYQFIDALHIQIHKGYGEFVDQYEDTVGSPQGCFCKACATALIDTFPGISRLVDL